jgi:hypothetical protein
MFCCDIANRPSIAFGPTQALGQSSALAPSGPVVTRTRLIQLRCPGMRIVCGGCMSVDGRTADNRDGSRRNDRSPVVLRPRWRVQTFLWTVFARLVRGLTFAHVNVRGDIQLEATVTAGCVAVVMTACAYMTSRPYLLVSLPLTLLPVAVIGSSALAQTWPLPRAHRREVGAESDGLTMAGLTMDPESERTLPRADLQLRCKVNLASTSRGESR